MARGLGLFLSSFFFFYAYATHYAVKMRIDGVERRPGEVYTGGQLLSIMLCIITASFALGGTSVGMKVVTEARVAANMAYEIIDRQPSVNLNEFE